MNINDAMQIASSPAMQAKMARIRAAEKAKKYAKLTNLEDTSSCCNAPVTELGYCATCGDHC